MGRSKIPLPSLEFSARAGDLQLLEGRWYVTHSGLVRLSRRNGCSGIQVDPVPRFCDAEAHPLGLQGKSLQIARLTGLRGPGDADPSNTSALVRGAEMRVAETRAVIAPYARPMESVSAQSKNLDISLRRPSGFREKGSIPVIRMETAPALASLGSATNSAY